MSINIKFTSDGKKVVVVGKINSDQHIVQEIFVKEDGSEIPGGENFVVTSLLDERVQTAKEVYLERDIKNLEDRKIKLDREVNSLYDKSKQIEKENRITKAVEDSLTASVKSLEKKDSLKMLFDFLNGKIKYIVKLTYSSLELHRADKGIPFDTDDGDRWHQKIKLVSLLGKSNGDLQFNLHQYSDGSGYSRYSNVTFYNSKKEALKYIKKQITEEVEIERISLKDYKNYIGYGIKFSEEFKEKLMAHFLSVNKINSDSHLKRLTEARESNNTVMDNIKKAFDD